MSPTPERDALREWRENTDGQTIRKRPSKQTRKQRRGGLALNERRAPTVEEFTDAE